MDGYKAVKDQHMTYDPERDGVWMHDGDEPVVFMPRNVIIGMVGVLADSPPTVAEGE